MGVAGVDRSRILGRRGPLSPAARAGPEHFGALDPARESPHGCLVECRAANESRSPALEEEKTALEKAVSGPALPLCYRGLNGCWLLFFIELVRKRLYERHCVHKGINGAYAISGNNAGGVIFDPYWAEPVVILIARD